jgi:hypothetical protein
VQKQIPFGDDKQEGKCNGNCDGNGNGNGNGKNYNYGFGDIYRVTYKERAAAAVRFCGYNSDCGG